MSDESPVPCPGCGKKHQWVQKFAGMRVRCTRCKGPMVMPYVPPLPPREPLPTEPVSATHTPPVADDAPPLLLDETEDSGLKLVEDSAPVIKPTPKPPASAREATPDTAHETAIPLDGAAGGDVREVDPYELDLPEEIETGQAVELRTCPDCGVNIHANTVICVSCGTNVETGEKATLQTGVDEHSHPPAPGSPGSPGSPGKAAMAGGVLTDRPMLAAMGNEVRRDDDPPNYAIDEIYIPVGLIVAGVILVLMDVFWILDTSLHLNDIVTEPSTVQWRYLFQHAFATVFQVPFLFGGIFLIGIWFGTSFASWTEVILKLFAVAVFLSGFGGCIESFLDRITEGFGGMGFYMTASAEFAVFWGISAKLFDLDFIEVMILYFVAFFAPAIAVFFFFAMAYTMVFG